MFEKCSRQGMKKILKSWPQWKYHVLRQEDRRIPKKILTYNPKISWNIRRPQLRWRDQHTLQEDGPDHGIIHEDDNDDDGYSFTKVIKVVYIFISFPIRDDPTGYHLSDSKVSSWEENETYMTSQVCLGDSWAVRLNTNYVVEML
jgi:hypothetical protein